MLILLYVSSLVTANLALAHFGPNFVPVIGFMCIGLDLSLRDRLHDKWQARLWPKMFLLIVLSGAISWLLNPAALRIASASVVAFIVASLTDCLVYQELREESWYARSNWSNVMGAMMDSVIFPVLAFGYFDVRIVVTMFLAKFAGGILWTWVIGRMKYGT